MELGEDALYQTSSGLDATSACGFLPYVLTYGCMGNLRETKGRDFPTDRILLQWAAVAARMADQRLLPQLMFVMH